jgi:hypothetical protein
MLSLARPFDRRFVTFFRRAVEGTVDDGIIFLADAREDGAGFPSSSITDDELRESARFPF